MRANGSAVLVLAFALLCGPGIAAAQEPSEGAAEGETTDTQTSAEGEAPPDGGVPADGAVPEPPGAPDEVPIGERTLRLAVAGNPPFVIEQGGELSGISVDVWRAVAARVGVDFELTRVAHATEAVEGVADGDFDGAIGPISITSSRAERVEFTQPYQEATLAILTRPGSAGFWERIKPFFTKAFLTAIAILFVVLALVGSLLWIIERKPNDDFPKTPVAGIGVGIWLALVTMTTVGYGDKAPITLPGRILTGIWMVVAMLTASSLTAGIATALTLSQLDRGSIETAGELGGHPVATLGGTTAAEFVRRHEGELVPVENVEEAIAKLEEGQVDAVVYDRPILQYHLRQDEDRELTLSDHEYEPQGYGFAFPLGDPIEHEVDVVLLELSENGRLAAINEEYL